MEKAVALACVVAGGLGFCWADDELGRDVGVIGQYVF